MAEVNISKDEFGSITVSFRYDPNLVARIKTIEGRGWHPSEKHWSFPNTDTILEKILEVFGDKEIHLDPALKAATSKVKDTPSPLEGEGQGSPRTRYGGEGYNFEDLQRELVSRKYSYKTIKGIFITTRILSIMSGRTHPKSTMKT